MRSFLKKMDLSKTQDSFRWKRVFFCFPEVERLNTRSEREKRRRLN